MISPTRPLFENQLISPSCLSTNDVLLKVSRKSIKLFNRYGRILLTSSNPLKCDQLSTFSRYIFRLIKSNKISINSLFCLGFMVLSATSNNISVISWRSVLLVEETAIPGENHQPVAGHWQTSSHNFVSSTPRMSGVRTHNVSDDRHWLQRRPPVFIKTFIC